MSKPTISIVVPTSGRRERVRQLVASLVQSDVDFTSGDWEILFSDNHSKYPVVDIVREHGDNLPIRVVSPPVFLRTAEENLFFAWGHAIGTYVWLLGDDDPIEFGSLQFLLDECKAQTHDAMLFDCRLIGPAGGLSRLSRLEFAEIVNVMPIKDFCLSTGFWYVSAGISTWVIRQSAINPDSSLDLVGSFISPIYAHVAAFIAALEKSRFAYINKPLVSYRIDYGEELKWAQYGANRNRPREEPWTTGFLEQFQFLVNKGIYSWPDLSRIVDQNRWGKPWLIFNIVVEKALKQFGAGLNDVRERFGFAEGLWLIEKLQTADPRYVDFYAAMRRAHLASHNSNEHETNSESVSDDILTAELIWRENFINHPYWSLYVSNVNGFSLFKGPVDYFAVPSGRLELVELALAGGGSISYAAIYRSGTLGGIEKIVADQDALVADSLSLRQPFSLPMDLVSVATPPQTELLVQPIFVRVVARLLPKKVKATVARWVTGRT